jgi:hypothetical protein
MQLSGPVVALQAMAKQVLLFRVRTLSTRTEVLSRGASDLNHGLAFGSVSKWE